MDMNRLLIYFTTLMLLLGACGHTYEYWPISQFNMDSSALIDNEEVKLLYSSQGPDNNQELEYYIHLIVISQMTGDTVNLLTTLDNGLSMADKDKVYVYFDEDNIMTKISLMDEEAIKGGMVADEIDKIETKRIDKVARDPKFDFIADNDFPTVIGILGRAAVNK